jgi:cysteinyl-tRNA synthetase
LDQHPDRLPDETAAGVRADRADMLAIGRVLGILKDSPAAFFDDRRLRAIETTAIDPAVVEGLIAERAAARKAKDWATADRIRGELDAMQVALEDRPDGSTTWSVTGG